MKWMENDFVAREKFFPTAKKSFSILFPSKYKHFSLGKKFLSRQKIFGTKPLKTYQVKGVAIVSRYEFSIQNTPTFIVLVY